jgi:hypothetical protein
LPFLDLTCKKWAEFEGISSIFIFKGVMKSVTAAERDELGTGFLDQYSLCLFFPATIEMRPTMGE